MSDLLAFVFDSDSAQAIKQEINSTAVTDGSGDDIVAIPASELVSGSAIWVGIPVPDGQTLTVGAWGVSTDENTTPAGLKVQLTQPDTTVISEESTEYTSEPPGASVTAAGLTTYRVRIKNDTGTDINSNNTPSAVTGWFAVRRE